MSQIDLGTVLMGNSSTAEPGIYTDVPQTDSAGAEPLAKHPEKHPDHEDVYYERCEEERRCHLDLYLEGQGRVLDVSLTLKHVCPGKRCAVGIFVTETGAGGHERPCGHKIITVAAHSHSACKDVYVPDVRFIIPEDMCEGGSGNMCHNCRHFIVRAQANYLDDAHKCDC